MRLILNWTLPFLLILASFNGLIKALSGIRYGPLLIDAALVLLLGLSIATRMIHNRLRASYLDLLAATFMFLAIAGMFNPNIPSFLVGLEGFRKFAFMIVGFFIGRYLMTNLRAIKIFLWSLIVTSFFISLYGIKQFLFPSALDYRLIELSSASPVTYLMGGHIRAFSTMSGPFHLGIYLVCTVLLIVIMGQRKKKLILWFLLLAAPQLIALIMTVTKSNWFGLFAGALTLIILSSRKPLQLTKQLLFIGIIGVSLIALAFVVSQTYTNFGTVNQGLQALLNPLEAPTFIFRLNLWKEEVVPLMLEALWLGYGTGSAGEGLGYLFEGTFRTYVISHNLLFKIQMELGIIGVIMFLLLISATLVHILNVRRRLRDPFLKGIANWILSFTVAVFVAGLTGAILDAYPVNLIFWLLLGIGTRLYRVQIFEMAPEPAALATGVASPNRQALSQ
jgi:O-antigen ligase